MAQPTNLYKTSDMRGIKEDADNAIYNLDPKETPFLSMCGSGPRLTDRQFYWQEDSYAAANKDNSRPEGDDFAGQAVTPTFMLRNHIQTFAKDIVTSGLANSVSKYGRSNDEQSYQMDKASTEIKTDIEAAFLSNNVAVAATGATAHKMAGLELFATSSAQHGVGGSTAALTNNALPTVAPTDGTTRALTQAIFLAGLRAGWQNGLKPRYSFQTLGQKAVIDTFVGAAAKQVTSAPGEMLQTPGVVDIFMWETGPIAHINVYDDRIRGRTMFVTDGECIKRRTHRPISRKKIAATGDNEKEMMITDVALQVTNRNGVLKIADLS